jgi:hypothetical protein
MPHSHRILTGLVVSVRSKARGTLKYRSIHKHAGKDPVFPHMLRPDVSNCLLITFITDRTHWIVFHPISETLHLSIIAANQRTKTYSLCKHLWYPTTHAVEPSYSHIRCGAPLRSAAAGRSSRRRTHTDGSGTPASCNSQHSGDSTNLLQALRSRRMDVCTYCSDDHKLGCGAPACAHA